MKINQCNLNNPHQSKSGHFIFPFSCWPVTTPGLRISVVWKNTSFWRVCFVVASNGRPYFFLSKIQQCFFFFINFFFFFFIFLISQLMQILTDARFKRNRKPEETAQWVEIEPRFEAIFKDERFAAVSHGKVDKKGRRLDKSKGVGDEFREFYQMGKKERESDEDDDDEDDDDEDEDEEDGAKSKRDAARWGKEESSSSSSSEGSDDEYDEDNDPLLDELVESRAGHVAVEYMDDGDSPTRRLACVNLNWDLLGAVDVLALVKSFCPPSGAVRKVTVYPSNFGRERMALEDVQGPILDLDLEETAKAVSEEVAKHRRDNALRKYELERRRYYFAIVECDSPDTAVAIYKACDGVDIEDTSSAFDLRYVPDEQTFENVDVRDQATIVPQNYVPPETMPEDGIASTKVKIACFVCFCFKKNWFIQVEVSWDVTPASRSRMTMKAPEQAELEDLDYAHLFASEGSDGDEDSSELRVKTKEKLFSLFLNKKEKVANEEDDEDVEQSNRGKDEAEDRLKQRIRAKYASLLEGWFLFLFFFSV
jgi:hypothetical protein